MKVNIKFEVDGIKFRFRTPIRLEGESYIVDDLKVDLEEFDHAICLSYDKEPYFFEVYLCRGSLEGSHILVSKDMGFGYELYEEIPFTEFIVTIIH